MQRRFVLLYLLSGCCALVLEMVWIRLLSVHIGSTVVSATVVFTLFFLGAAVGNLLGGRLLRRFAHPLLLYGLCELLAAGCGLAAFLLRGHLYALLQPLVGPDGGGATLAVHSIYALLLVGIPACISAMAFPALSTFFVTETDRRTTDGGLLYGGNLLGAAAGILLGGVLLPRWCGYHVTLLLALAGQAGIGLIVLASGRHTAPAGPPPPKAARPRRIIAPSPLPAGGLGMLILAGSGLLSLMLETVLLAYFQQLATGSIYLTTTVLFAVLVNLGLGCLFARLLRQRGVAALSALRGVLLAGGLLILAYPALFAALARAGMPWLAGGTGGRFTGALLLATAGLFPLLLCLGAVFPLAWELIERAQTRHGRVLGQALAVNKLGAALGAPLAAFALLPRCGLPGTLIGVGAGYLLLAGALAWSLPTRSPRAPLVAAGVLAALLAAFVTRTPPVMLAPGDRLLATYTDAYGMATVIEDAAGSRRIILNQTYGLNGTGRALRTQQQESWIPLLLTPEPRRVAFIGMASGISARSALDFPITHLDAIELVPAVARAARAQFAPWNAALFTDPRAQVILNDGRFVIQASRQPYDLVIIDLLHPALEGASSLYAREFLLAVRARLAPGGRCCLWLPTYQLTADTAGMILRTFLEVFPQAIAVRGNLDPLQPVLGLIGAERPLDLSTSFLARQLRGAGAQRVGDRSPFFRSVADARLLLLGDLADVRTQFAAYPRNTDAHPHVAFRGPAPIPAGRGLRGLTFLNWFGRRFLTPSYPSCTLGTTPPVELLQGIRAGNYAFAAAVMDAEIPVDAEARVQREAARRAYLAHARALSPAIRLRERDLGQ